MIFNSDETDDVLSILQYIEGYAIKHSFKVQVDIKKLSLVIEEIRKDFPYKEGIEKSSTFKKVANFISHFLYIKPIAGISPNKDDLPISCINATIALEISILSIEGSKIFRKDGTALTIDNKLFISNHSYIDLIDALVNSNIQPAFHQKILATLFEQITYKTNPHCQYKELYTNFENHCQNQSNEVVYDNDVNDSKGKNISYYNYYGDSWVCDKCGIENSNMEDCSCGNRMP